MDHLVICFPSLDAGVRYADAKGLASVPGGRHTGHGTANRIVPLGDSYLELVAVVDGDEAQGSAFGSWVATNARGEIGVDAVCLGTDDLDSVCDRLGLVATPMSRTRPDGVELSWRLAGLEEALRDGVPFFIEWGVTDEELPGRTPIDHRVGPASVEQVIMRGDVERLNRWIGEVDVIQIGDGDPGASSVTLMTDSGAIAL